jgi:hypothetical protein
MIESYENGRVRQKSVDGAAAVDAQDASTRCLENRAAKPHAVFHTVHHRHHDNVSDNVSDNATLTSSCRFSTSQQHRHACARSQGTERCGGR